MNKTISKKIAIGVRLLQHFPDVFEHFCSTPSSCKTKKIRNLSNFKIKFQTFLPWQASDSEKYHKNCSFAMFDPSPNFCDVDVSRKETVLTIRFYFTSALFDLPWRETPFHCLG